MFRRESFERLPFRIVVAWPLAASIVGLVLAIATSSPMNLVHDVAAARLVFILHGTLGSMALMASVVTLAAMTPDRSRALDVLLLVAALLPIVYLVPAGPDPAWFPLASGPAAFAAVVAVVVTWRGLRARGFTPGNAGLGLAGIALLLGAIALFLGRPPASALDHATYVVLLGALGALAEPAADEPQRVLTSAGLVLLAAASYLPFGDDPTTVFALIVLFGQVVLGAAVIGAVFVGRARRFPNTAARLAAALAVVLFAPALLARLFLAATAATSHLRDTYFVTALGHATWIALITAILADWLRRREPRPGRSLRHAPVAGIVASGAGAVVLVWAYAIMGTRGMPLGYLRYVEQLTTGHIVAAIGATVWLLGMVTVVATTRRMPPPAPVVTEVFA